MAPPIVPLFKNLRVFQVFGANTDVGKTVFSTAILRQLQQVLPGNNIGYIKPVSTGPHDEADIKHIKRHASRVRVHTLLQFDDPVSPHLAARNARRSITDASLLAQLSTTLLSRSETSADSYEGAYLVETAGGPLSPGPNGNLQADLYRPFRLPVIYIADSSLGGISTSISGYESLKTRGYDVAGVAMFENAYYQNHEFLQPFFAQYDIPFHTVPSPPRKVIGPADEKAMDDYYGYLDNAGTPSFVDHLFNFHSARLERLNEMASHSLQSIWWPFTQHRGMTPKDITVIDSAHGDHFQTFQSDPTHDVQASLLSSAVDGSASWWTQGLGHSSHSLSMTAAYAAGRYGHVMFAGATNQPALTLASKLLEITKQVSQLSHPPKLDKVFYSDNGSTGMEVAVKMALNASCKRYGWDSKSENIEIIGLQGSYHGDTIGCMDMSEPSVYNDKIHWYEGRGHWFESPFVIMRSGKWVIQLPTVMQQSGLQSTFTFEELHSIFDKERDSSDLAESYADYIKNTLITLTQTGKRKFGALVMEPVVLGAGGMLLIDPLFQRTLARVVRQSATIFCPNRKNVESGQDPTRTEEQSVDWTGLPIVHDEVFTGLFRLGHGTPSILIDVAPDIAVYAKLLTGGLIPLSCTLASNSIFQSFLGDGKSEALLHGHSYTAHPVGCSVAVESLKTLSRLAADDGAWSPYRRDWSAPYFQSKRAPSHKGETSSTKNQIEACNSQVWSVWSRSFVSNLSHATRSVDGVWALGSILAISLKDSKGGGYISDAAKVVQKRLLDGHGTPAGRIHSRVLGNVLYLMTSQVAALEDVRHWEDAVLASIDP